MQRKSKTRQESDPQKETDNTADGHQMSYEVKAKNGHAIQANEGF